jgi:hypothetical protein
MSRDERSLLLYFETCVVDLAGRVDPRRMNEEDEVIANKWADKGFINYGRIASADHNSQGCLWVEFSADAWSLAHQARRQRAAGSTRRYRKTSEL